MLANTDKREWFNHTVMTLVFNTQVKYTDTSLAHQLSAYQAKGELALRILDDPTLLAGSSIESEALARNVSADDLVLTVANKYNQWKEATLKAELLRIKYKLILQAATDDTDFSQLFQELQSDFSAI